MKRKIIYFILIVAFFSCKTTKLTTNKKTQDLIEKELNIFISFINSKVNNKYIVTGDVYMILKHHLNNSIYYSFHNDELYDEDYLYSLDDIYFNSKKYPKLKLIGYKFKKDNLICLYNNVDLHNINRNIKSIPKLYNSLSPHELNKYNYQAYGVTFKLIDNKLVIENTTSMSEEDLKDFINLREKLLKKTDSIQNQ